MIKKKQNVKKIVVRKSKINQIKIFKLLEKQVAELISRIKIRKILVGMIVNVILDTKPFFHFYYFCFDL